MCENVYICRFCGFLSASRIVRPDSASRIGVPFWRPELGGVRVPNELFIKVQVACFTLFAHCVHTCTRVYSCVFRRGVSASRLGLRANRVYPKGSGPEKLIEVWKPGNFGEIGGRGVWEN